MKKILSVLMAILMLSMTFIFVAGAAAGACGCEDHDAVDPCHCCLECDNLDLAYVTSCRKDTAGNLIDSFCCQECTGILPCKCGCECCAAAGEDPANPDAPDKIFTDEQQEQIIDAFQNILRQISDFFDKLFNAIFEFLRFDEIMGA